MKTKIAAALFCALGLLATSCNTMTPTPMKNPPPGGVTLSDFKLTGDLGGEVAAFTLTATASVADARGGSLDAAFRTGRAHPPRRAAGMADERRPKSASSRTLTAAARFPSRSISTPPSRGATTGARWIFASRRARCSRSCCKGWRRTRNFSSPAPRGPNAAGTNFLSYLPVDGSVKFAWKQSRPETEGKLFYAAEMTSQISVSPGLMRQADLINGKVMQGEMNRLALRLHGDGEVTRVQGDAVLSWNVEAGTNSADRRLVVQFNQPQKDAFAIFVQMQTPLGAFPQSADAMQVQPEGATRFAGAFRIVNDGAVRLEVAQASGLSQISPDQFPEANVFRATGSQRFAYLFSSADFALQIQADQILPEIGVSQVLAYNLGENELSVDAEIELDIREAPLREVLLNIPKGYAVAQAQRVGHERLFCE